MLSIFHGLLDQSELKQHSVLVCNNFSPTTLAVIPGGNFSSSFG